MKPRGRRDANLQSRDFGCIMADRVKEFAGRMGNAPKGVSLGFKLLAGAAVLGYGIKESLYTGKPYLSKNFYSNTSIFLFDISTHFKQVLYDNTSDNVF